jgi:hypothetical protein
LPKTTQSRQSYDTMTAGFGSGSNGPMLIAVSLSKPAHDDQAKLDKLQNQKQNAVRQVISKQQAKVDKEIQQQTEQAQQEAKQKIEAEAKQQQQAAQKIQAEAAQNVGPVGQAAIQRAAQEEILKQNQAIQKRPSKR